MCQGGASQVVNCSPDKNDSPSSDDVLESSTVLQDSAKDEKGGTNDTAAPAPAPADSSSNDVPEAGVDDYFWTASDEPHAIRRMEILAKYPEIKRLYGHDPVMKYKILTACSIQITAAWYFSTTRTVTSSGSSWWWWFSFVLTAYVVGGTCNHMCFMAFHELSHNLGFKTMQYNKWFAYFVNIPLVFPAAASFRRYHMDHHKYQGLTGVDVDIPTVTEGDWIGNSALFKLAFLFFQIFFYAGRPLLVNPKKPGSAELLNAAVCLSADAAMLYFWGYNSLFYLGLSTLFGGGLHPCAGHFLSEHYIFHTEQRQKKSASATNCCPSPDNTINETYSYYGPLNAFTLNVGYHNEHHDFPFVPGSRLPELKKIAAEYYDPLPYHDSWTKVLWDYITDPNMTPYSRVARKAQAQDMDGPLTQQEQEQHQEQEVVLKEEKKKDR